MELEVVVVDDEAAAAAMAATAAAATATATTAEAARRGERISLVDREGYPLVHDTDTLFRVREEQRAVNALQSRHVELFQRCERLLAGSRLANVKGKGKEKGGGAAGRRCAKGHCSPRNYCRNGNGNGNNWSGCSD